MHARSPEVAAHVIEESPHHADVRELLRLVCASASDGPSSEAPQAFNVGRDLGAQFLLCCCPIPEERPPTSWRHETAAQFFERFGRHDSPMLRRLAIL
jgi:hypothetical protein